jgi:thiosulfate dehydrogenase
MSNLLSSLLSITAIGLMALLSYVLRRLDEVNRIFDAENGQNSDNSDGTNFLKKAKYYIYIPAAFLAFIALCVWQKQRYDAAFVLDNQKKNALAQFDTAKIWEAPDPLNIKAENEAKLIQYGRDLIAHTSDYLGPEGIVKPISNGMNCQNCHIEAGSKPFGNNYMAVASTYPKFRARSGTAETIYKRVNDCFQRSLNGQPLDSTSREMKAIEAYIRWLGQAVPKGKTPKGTGLMKLKYLNRATNPDSGLVVFIQKCQSCHGENGQGLPMPEGNRRRYPPLWGEKSYNEAAGLFRISNFAGYVKANMPFGATYENPQLTDAEAWDVAAFVNSQPHPKHPFLATDFPKIDGKPVDHPFAPFADSFPEIQHKFGPFQPIVDWQNKKKAEKEAKKIGK